jgi:ABC-type Fe3+-hydroxamate transport system substrate-binding protein
VSNIAFGQIYYDGFLVDKNKAAKLRESTHKAILTSTNNPMLIAYSAGILNLRNMTDEEIEKVSEVILINPFLGDKVIADKYRIMGKIFPKTDKAMEELKPVLEKLVKLNKLIVITSDNDNFLKSKTMIDLLKDIVPPELFTVRNGDHGITQQELINLINNF